MKSNLVLVPGDLVYKKTGSPLSQIVSIDGTTAVIEYIYSVGPKVAGQRELVDVSKLEFVQSSKLAR